MSETVNYRGKLKLIPRHRLETDSEYVVKVFEEFALSKDKLIAGKSIEEILDDNLEYKEYYIRDNEVYKVLDLIDDEGGDIFNVNYLGDATFDFHLCYYNGGCGFDEALDEGFKKLKL